MRRIRDAWSAALAGSRKLGAHSGFSPLAGVAASGIHVHRTPQTIVTHLIQMLVNGRGFSTIRLLSGIAIGSVYSISIAILKH